MLQEDTMYNIVRSERCLKWKNYKSHVSQLYFHLFETESMVDVTLCAEGQLIQAHRIVLSSSSPYLKSILSSSGESHPFIILSEMKFEDVKCIIEFMYRGEISLPADRVMTMLKTAEDLQINGLMEVGDCVSADTYEGKEDNLSYEVYDAVGTTEIAVGQNISIYIDSNDASFGSSINNISGLEPSEVLIVTTDGNKPNRTKKRKRESSKKEYTEEALAAALEDVKSGKPVLEASIAHHIPRSTLYVQAKNHNISIAPCRQDHPYEKMQAALKAVSDGASLQQASDLFKIPKTVIWRRVHKDARNSSVKQVKHREACGFERKSAAIMALERGEKISKVSMQYQIPRTTLFREKTRLVESGKLPWTSQKKRSSGSDEYKELRLNEAVAACKEGKMSQASASQKFQVPKTTIWRRLKDARLQESSSTVGEERKQSSMENLPSEGNNLHDPGSLISTVTEHVSLPNSVDELVHENIVDSHMSQGNPMENCSNPENNSDLDPSHAQCSSVSHLHEQSVFSLEEVPTHMRVAYMDEANFADSSLIILATNDENGIELQGNTQLIIEPNSHSQCVVVSEGQEDTNCNSQNESEFLEK